MELPKPNRFELPQVIAYICQLTEKPGYLVGQSLHDALREGFLKARGTYHFLPENKFDSLSNWTQKKGVEIPPEVWERLSVNDFSKMIEGKYIPQTEEELGPYFEHVTVLRTDIDSWLSNGSKISRLSDSHKPRTITTAPTISTSECQSGKKFENPFIPVSEALVFIAVHEWMSFQQYLDNFVTRDIFRSNPFQNVGPYYNMSKAKVLLYLKNNNWTEKNWEEAQLKKIGNPISSLELMEKVVSEVCKKFDMTKERAMQQLESSINLDRESEKELENAEQQLINAAKAEKIKIYGVRHGSDGNPEAVPLEFLLRDDFETALWGDKFIPLLNDSITLGQIQKRQRVDEIGWHNLQVNRAKVSELWSNQEINPESAETATKTELKRSKKPAHKRDRVKAYIANMNPLPKSADKELIKSVKSALGFDTLDDETVRGAIQDVRNERNLA